MAGGSGKKVIAYQGEAGANSHLACRAVYPGWEPLACPTFEDAFAAIADGTAELGKGLETAIKRQLGLK